MTRAIPVAILMIAIGTTACATDSNRYGNGYSHNNRTYASREECLRAKKDAKTKGAVVGAVGGAAAGALLGGNLGGAALASGAGAAGGAAIGGKNRGC